MNKQKPTLLILAAGMGSRFGGLKQVEPVGPNGETIIEYSIYDAIRAGFGKVVFVIRESFADAFKEKFASLLEGRIEVEYVYQELDKLPAGFVLPEGREKPWGTGHAILMAKEVINEPFAAINADDFYGKGAFQVTADFFNESENEQEYSMVGYRLINTLSDFGSVSRGICEMDQDNNLTKITETHGILSKDQKIVCNNEKGEEVEIAGDAIASMNFWAFKANIFKYLEEQFIDFLKEKIEVPKSEFYIPSVVFNLIQSQTINSKVLTADSPWFGVTYKEDQPEVVNKLNKLIEAGEYPNKLWA